MKRIFNKNILALLVLASAGLTSTAQAASETTVIVRATVAEKFEVEVQPEMDIDSASGKGDFDINVKSNLAGSTNKAKVTVSADAKNVEADKLVLADGANKLKVDVKLGGQAFTGGSASVNDAVVGTPVKLHLQTVADAGQKAGTYTGHLTVKVDKA